VVVVEVNEEFAVIDANHHLAGKALTFQLTLVSIG
jgi:FKBP-type peptidyl-prolyl cis-trans isomerase 2